jgi:hypothetical protein
VSFLDLPPTLIDCPIVGLPHQSDPIKFETPLYYYQLGLVILLSIDHYRACLSCDGPLLSYMFILESYFLEHKGQINPHGVQFVIWFGRDS